MAMSSDVATTTRVRLGTVVLRMGRARRRRTEGVMLIGEMGASSSSGVVAG